MDQQKLKSIIESLLFMSGEPLSVSRIVKITGAKKPEIENAVMVLAGENSAQKRGLSIIKKDGQIQMATSPENYSYVQALTKSELQELLSPVSLEVLSIIAYRGPINRSGIEFIRGVNCSYTIRNLLMRGLVERKENPKDNREYIYSVSFEFLKKLGIDDMRKLPDYEELSKDERISFIINNQE